jgi:hypothetical protein
LAHQRALFRQIPSNDFDIAIISKLTAAQLPFDD